MKEFDLYIKELKELISYKTKLAPADGDAPFGEQTKLCLQKFLSLAQSFGFETVNYDNYGGEVIFGEGEEIGIMGHLDVVPEGENWDTDPYVLTKIGDKYFGRGIDDDKGPTLMCLFALKEIKDMGVKPKKKFRLLLGCNEETGWKDVDYMKTKTKFPTYGFSPDGNFPVSYAEKGMYVVSFYIPKLKNFSNLCGGTVINAVCEKAKCNYDENGIDESLINKHGLSMVNGEIVSVGKTAHGSTPHLGVNALNNLFNYFLDMGEDVKNVCDYVLNDKSGLRNLGNEQGMLTMSPDLLLEKDDQVIIKCDLRVPAPLSLQDVKPYLDEFGIKYTAEEKHNPFMAEKESELCQKLLRAYIEVTGEKDAKPVAMGGSTFARVFDKGYSFGIGRLYNYKSCAHESNEGLEEKVILGSYAIYLHALLSLAKE